MKKLLVALALLLCGATLVHAQDYRKFRVGLDLGYAIPTDYDAGLIIGFEPKFAITPNIGVGVRWEGALLAAIDLGGESSANLNSSFLATGDYWFLPTNTFRPFLGLGLGAYSMAGASTKNSITYGSKTNFGFMVRGGFDVWHMRLALEYNYAGKDAVDHNGSYLGVVFGVYFGGGKKK